MNVQLKTIILSFWNRVKYLPKKTHPSASQHLNGRLLDNELALPVPVCVCVCVCDSCVLAREWTTTRPDRTRRVLSALRDHLTCRVRSPQARIMTSGAAVCTLAAAHPMAWTNERLKLSCADGIGLKSLWKMLVLDKSGGGSARSNSNVCVINLHPIIFFCGWIVLSVRNNCRTKRR